MRTISSYNAQLFWTDQTPVENILGTFVQNQLIDFVTQKTLEEINKLPKEIRQKVFDKLVTK